MQTSSLQVGSQSKKASKSEISYDCVVIEGSNRTRTKKSCMESFPSINLQ